MEERPAEGFDARLTGYLPFYRNLAVTGGYEKWKGDHVGSFGNDDVVQKDPKIWSYGLEWTPVPAFSTSVNQRHSGGQKETQFGLTFNYHFGMDWEDQLSPAMVAEMRTVDGSRHEFVNRQNEIILAYQAKEGAYNIVQRGSGGANIFLFQITNGFGEPVAGQRVAVSLPAGVVDSGNGAYTSDADGLIRLVLTTVPPAALPVVATLTAGKTSRSFTLGATSTFTGLVLSGPSFDRASFVTGNDLFSTATVTAEAWQNGAKQTINAGDITWEVASTAINGTPAWWTRAANVFNGLTWGSTAMSFIGSVPAVETTMNGAAPTGDTATLTDIVGSRTVVLKATWNGDPGNPQTVTVTFGDGPLSVFGARPGNSQWANTNNITTASSFPAASACSGTVNNGASVSSWPPSAGDPYWENVSGNYYAVGSKLPKTAELQAVAGTGVSNPTGSKGAALAAGWPVAYYWTGEVVGTGVLARLVDLVDGYVVDFPLDHDHPVVCRP